MVRKVKDESHIEKRFGVFVTDIEALVTVLLEARDIDPEQYEILLGADDGQEILKVNYYFFIAIALS